jgi:hypothetical protein
VKGLVVSDSALYGDPGGFFVCACVASPSCGRSGILFFLSRAAEQLFPALLPIYARGRLANVSGAVHLSLGDIEAGPSSNVNKIGFALTVSTWHIASYFGSNIRARDAETVKRALQPSPLKCKYVQ